MLNSSQFSGGPNPGLLAIGGIEKGLDSLEKHVRNKQRLQRYQRYKQRSGAYADATTLQQHTESNLPTTDKEPKMAKEDMATHPITGEKVPRVPVKRSNYKPTPPGTKPKKRK